MRWIRRFAGPLAGLALITLGCREGADGGGRRLGLQLQSVEIVPRDDGHLEEAVRTGVIEAVARARSLAADPVREGVASLVGRIAVGAIESPDGAPILRVELVADTPAALHAAIGPRLDATVELERMDGTLRPEEDVPVAVGRAVAVLDAKLVLSGGDPADVRRLLADPDAEVVLLALDHAGRQRMRAVADDVAALLPNDDDRVMAAAVECLGLVGSAEHTPVLLRHVRLGDRAQAQRLYEALAVLGGEDAAEFLEFAARNEDDPALADVARGALRRVQMPGTTGGIDNGLRGHRP